MRWIITGFALAALALIGTDVARACGGCCKGGGSACPSCPQPSGSAGSAAPATGPAACPNCPRTEATSGAYRYPGSDAAYSPYSVPATRTAYNPSAGDGRTRPVMSPPPIAPVVTYSTSYLAVPPAVQTTARYERPAR